MEFPPYFHIVQPNELVYCKDLMLDVVVFQCFSFVNETNTSILDFPNSG